VDGSGNPAYPYLRIVVYNKPVNFLNIINGGNKLDSINKQAVNDHRKLAIKMVFRIALLFVFLGLIFFLTAGSIRYWEAWIYFVTLIIPAFFVIVYFFKKDPDFIESRILKRREKEKVHRSIQNSFSIIFLIGLLIPGFDFRFQWTDIPLFIVLISDVFVLIGYLIIARVMEENRYASAIIEISQEQKVIETGPYKIVRHPMYSGGMIFLIFTPLALGSYWALIPFLIITLVALILRIINEEKLLIANLPGYKEYCQKTKYRLIPFIW
jgi:protein-S-isoprenylcysteine O-methyltransferase Ste14